MIYYKGGLTFELHVLLDNGPLGFVFFVDRYDNHALRTSCVVDAPATDFADEVLEGGPGESYCSFSGSSAITRLLRPTPTRDYLARRQRKGTTYTTPPKRPSQPPCNSAPPSRRSSPSSIPQSRRRRRSDLRRDRLYRVSAKTLCTWLQREGCSVL